MAPAERSAMTDFGTLDITVSFAPCHSSRRRNRLTIRSIAAEWVPWHSTISSPASVRWQFVEVRTCLSSAPHRLAIASRSLLG